MEQRPLEESGLVEPTSRREFLKKSAVAGAVVWSAPAIATLPGGGAWAQTYGNGCDCEENAFALFLEASGIINIAPTTVPADVPGELLFVSVGNLVQARVLPADTENCFARASVADVTVNLGAILDVGGLLSLNLDLPTIFATVLESRAEANGGCPTASSSVVRVALNGDDALIVGLNADINLDVLGAVAVSLVVNEVELEDCNDGQTRAFANALHLVLDIDLGGVVDGLLGNGGLLGGLINIDLGSLTQHIELIVSHAEVTGCNCPC